MSDGGKKDNFSATGGGDSRRGERLEQNDKTGSNTQKKPSKAQEAPWTAVCSCYCMRMEKNGL